MTGPEPGAGFRGGFERVSELGFAPMDRVHAEFEALLMHAQVCPEHELLDMLLQLDAHMRGHFGNEDSWMKESGFASAKCHIEEHAAVLSSSEEVIQRVRQGNVVVARAFIREVIHWFPAHASHLDSALAGWMCDRRFGGRPIVLQVRSGSDKVRPQE